MSDNAYSDARSYRESHLGTDLATAYDDGFWDASTAKGQNWRLERAIIDRELEQRRLPADFSALDFACGTGRVLAALESRTDRTYGIDVSQDMLDRAKTRCPRSILLKVDVTSAEVADDLPGAPYELITAFRFFLNAEPALRRQALAWMRSQLAPDGLLIANFHLNPRSARGRYLRLRWRARQRTPMIDVPSARRLVERAGFHVLDVIGYEFLPYRRDGSRLLAPALRGAVETCLVSRRASPTRAGSFIIVAECGRRARTQP